MKNACKLLLLTFSLFVAVSAESQQAPSIDEQLDPPQNAPLCLRERNAYQECKVEWDFQMEHLNFIIATHTDVCQQFDAQCMPVYTNVPACQELASLKVQFAAVIEQFGALFEQQTQKCIDLIGLLRQCLGIPANVPLPAPPVI